MLHLSTWKNVPVFLLSSCMSNRVDQFRIDYADLKGKPFFPGLIKYMASGPVVAMVWEGLDAVKTGRVMLGATNPLASAPGQLCLRICSIRAILRNLRVNRNHPRRLRSRCWPQHLPWF